MTTDFMVGEPLTLFPGYVAEVFATHKGAVRHDQPATAHAAAAAVAPRVGGQKAACLAALAAAGERGLNDYELSVLAMIRRPHVAGTRRAELQRAGLVMQTDRTRPTDTGAQAAVWVVTDAGRKVAAELAE